MVIGDSICFSQGATVDMLRCAKIVYCPYLLALSQGLAEGRGGVFLDLPAGLLVE